MRLFHGLVSFRCAVSAIEGQARFVRRRGAAAGTSTTSHHQLQQQPDSAGSVRHTAPDVAPADSGPQQPPVAEKLHQSQSKSTLHSIRNQIDSLRSQEQRRRLAEELRRAASASSADGRTSSSDALGQLGPQAPRYSRAEMEEAEKILFGVMSKETRDEFEDVLRTAAPKYKRVLAALDPVTRFNRLARAKKLYAQLTEARGEGTVVEFLDSLSDDDLLTAIHSGVIDPFSFTAQEEDEGLDVAELSAIPGEFFEGAHVLRLTEELRMQLKAAQLRDDVAPALAKLAHNAPFSEFTETDLRELERYEKERHGPMGVRRNAVLDFVAQHDVKFAEALSALERTQLTAATDEGFQNALQHSRKLEAYERSHLKVAPRPRKSAVDSLYYFGSSASRPPKRALLATPRLRRSRYRKTYANRLLHLSRSKPASKSGSVPRLYHD